MSSQRSISDSNQQSAPGVSGHTPGPWHAVKGYPGSGPWDRLTIETAEVVVCGVNRLIPECEANARLIAAAPDLLVALQELRTRCEGEICDGDLLDRVDALLRTLSESSS